MFVLGQSTLQDSVKPRCAVMCVEADINSAVCEKGDTNISDTDYKDDVVSSFASHSVKIQPNKQNAVLLQTVRAWAGGPGGRKSIRCLLDGGSQRSFITENTVRALKLPVTIKKPSLFIPLALQHQ